MTEPWSPRVDSDASTKLKKQKNSKDSMSVEHYAEHYASVKLNQQKTSQGSMSSLPHDHKRKLTDFPSDILQQEDLERYYDGEALNLSNQHLGHLHLSALADNFLFGLRKLDLSDCILTQIPRGLARCSELEELNLSNNPLGDSDISSFFESIWPCSLRKLNLSACGIKQFPRGLNFYVLEVLDLSNNPLGDSAMSSVRKSLLGLHRLRKLNLSACGLKQFPEYLYFDDLEELDLSNNPLGDAFHTLPILPIIIWLKKLNLSACGLKKWPFIVCQPINLQELNLSNNSINHQHIFENIRSFLSLQESCDGHLEPTPLGLGIFLARRIIFEDAVYVQTNGAWEKRPTKAVKDVQTSAGLTSSKTLNEEQIQQREENWYERNASGDRSGDIWLEWCQIKKSEKLTFKTYCSILQSLDIISKLLIGNDRSRKVANDQELTINSLCHQIISFSRHRFRICSLRIPAWALSGAVFLLGEFSVGGYRKWDDTLEYCSVLSKYASNEAEKVFFRKPLNGTIEAAKVMISLKILGKLNNPDDTVLSCLRLLQQLHDHREIKKIVCSVVRNTTTCRDRLCDVYVLNRVLFQFVQTVIKPPPKADDWPATIKLDEEIFNPFTDDRLLKEISTLVKARTPFGQKYLDDCDIGNKMMQAAKDVSGHHVPIIETTGNSITVTKEGGCFRILPASAFLVFLPNAVEEEVTLTFSRVKYKECKVKPIDGELFVSRILKLEPEGVIFLKPVTVLLSHSVYEDQLFVDFYELVIESVSHERGWKELKTEFISSSDDIPEEISEQEALVDYLPLAKATIHETCTLVIAARVRSDQILIPTNRKYVYSKEYGENIELKITFPAGVTKEILCLKVQVLPADSVLKKDVHSDKNLVCAPVVKVSGQTTPFHEAVNVELSYSNNDVESIEEEFLPVGNKIKFTNEYGLLVRSEKKTELKSKCTTLNDVEGDKAYIERLRVDKLKFSFSLKHFCKICQIAKKSAGAQLPDVAEDSVVNPFVSHNLSFLAIVLAVHHLEKNTLYAFLAPITAQHDLKVEWKVTGSRLGPRLKTGDKIYICVPLDQNATHLPLEDCVLWFDHEKEFELANKTCEDVQLKEKYMYFLMKKCTGKNHNFEEDGRGKVEIQNFGKRTDKENNEPSHGTSSSATVMQANGVSSVTREAPGGTINNITHQNEVMKQNIGRYEYFEKEIENQFLARLGINKEKLRNPNVGATAKIISDAGTVSSIILGLGVGTTIALSIGSFGIGSIVGATIVGLTFTVTKIDKKMKKLQAQKLDEKVETFLHSHLKCMIMDVAKELSRMFEYQVLTLEDLTQVDILAECAVDLMLDLKEGDKIDRNTLLRKIIKEGKVKKKELVTSKGDKWFAPDVFRKPGLQQTVIGTNDAKFIYLIKPNGDCETAKYGYRGQFLEWKNSQNKENGTSQVTSCRKTPAKKKDYAREDPHKELCNECFSNDKICTSSQYFVESEIDSEYTVPSNELLTYHPIHILVQCPRILDSFINNQVCEEKLSFADFLKNKLDLPKHHLVHPVYRQHSPGKIPDLQKSDLTGSDFSHSNFQNSCLMECNFTKCVMLFAELARAKISCSSFRDTYISHSNLEKVIANHCEWTKTSLLYSRVDGAFLDSVEPSIGGNTLDGTNISDAITTKKELNHNETPV